MPLEQDLEKRKKQLHESFEVLQELMELGKPTAKTLAYLEKRLLTPLIDKGYIIKREYLRSYFEINYDFIKNHIVSVCPNQEYLLELAKERINEVDMSQVFNPESYMESKDEEVPPPLFLKFFMSYLAYYRQEMFFGMLIHFRKENIDIGGLFR